VRANIGCGEVADSFQISKISLISWFRGRVVPPDDPRQIQE